MPQISDGKLYELICEEIERHLEDSEVSKLAHFHAAAIYEKRNKYFLGLPATLSALLLSWFVSQDVANKNIEPLSANVKLILSLIVSLLSGLVTFLNFNEIASKHRVAAQRYQQIWRKCKNWHTDFPDDTKNEDARKMAQQYREELNEINLESPQIPKWAWKSTQKQQNEGSTKYEKEKQRT